MSTSPIAQKAESLPLRLARRLTAPRRLALRNTWSKVVLARRVPAMRRFEDAEVARLAAESDPLPEARVATILITYRRPEALRRAVRSALAQTVPDHVVIVMDDAGGLPDLPADPRLRVCSLSVNSGAPSVVRNIGMGLTRSSYVAFLDDDNEWEPDHLERALAGLEAGPPGERPDLVYTALRRVFPDGRELDILSVPFDRRLLARHAFVDTNSLVIRRCPHLHFSRRPLSARRPPDDWELVWRLTRKHRVAHIEVPTVRYLCNPGSYYSDWQEVMPSPPGGDTDDRDEVSQSL
jgi:glycosyltransferase involved in cell wall biosynthesis